MAFVDGVSWGLEAYNMAGATDMLAQQVIMVVAGESMGVV
jgi:hypothetical protein